MNDTAQQALLPILRLPGRVMLPHATRLLRLPAPVVEKIASALRGDRRLAVGLELPRIVRECRVPEETSNELLPSEGEPVCICQVVAVRRMPQGAARILLRGVSRGVHFSTRHQHDDRVAETAHVEIRPDQCFDPPTIDRSHRCEELVLLLKQCTPGASEAPLIRSLLEQVNLGTLCDLIADCVAIGGNEGLQLLSAANVEQRSDTLLDILRARLRQERLAIRGLGTPSMN
jgi:ATP-dependent Lon protease